jgi:serine phosphatase RsbU (regulator of sigma subunit)
MHHRDEARGRGGPRVSIRVDGLDGPGGDFVVHVETRPNRFLCVVGDVTGHGPRVAGYRIELAARLEVLARAGAGPARLLNSVNAEIESSWPPDMFACLVCIDIDVRRRHAVIAVAGHLPPIL